MGQVAIVVALQMLLALSGVARASDDGSVACSNRLSRGFRAYLPDCRAYELVSPDYKEGFLVALTGVSEDGSRVLAQSFGAFAGTGDTSALPQSYELARTEEGSEPGWKPIPLTVPFSEFSSYLVEAISPTFQSDLWFASRPSAAAGQPSPEAVYSGSPASPSPLSLVGPGESPAGGGSALMFAGGSEDLSHTLFIVTSPNSGEFSHLWPGDKTADGRLPSLYQYVGAGNSEPELVGVKNQSSLAEAAQIEGKPHIDEAAELVSDCGTYLGDSKGDAYNAISINGERVFFAAEACGGEPAFNEVYARIGRERTVAISEPSKADCGGCDLSEPANAEFQGASSDGSKVFFTTTQHLLPGTTGTGMNLYEYNFDAGKEERVTRISREAEPPGMGDVLGVMRVSEDGSHVYFVAEGALTGANGEGKSPTPGAPNLFVSTRECPGGEPVCGNPVESVSFVATLSTEDSAEESGDWSSPDLRPVQATPEGRFLLFQSVADLTADQGESKEAGQVFEYDAQTEKLLRVSRGESGFNEDGNSGEYRATIPVQDYEGDSPIQRFTRLAISADGSRVFFSSKDALTPQALNGFNNVYEYHNGQVGLISDGHDTASTEGFPAVELVGTDESGLDVFFMTSDRLVPQDTDDQVDIYDARMGGGFAGPSEPAHCLADSCQGATSSAPALLMPQTSSIAGEVTGSASGVTSVVKSKVKAKAKPKPKKRRRPKPKRRTAAKRRK